MSRRGTILTAATGSAGYLVSRWFPWQHFMTGQITGAATTLIGGLPSAAVPLTTSTALGKSGQTWPLTALFITTADVVGLSIPDIEDVALGSPIYFEPLLYTKTGMSAADVLTVTGLYHEENPLAGVGSADAFGVDTGVAFAATGSITLVAGDVVRLKYATGAHIAGASLTSNSSVLTTRFTFTLTTASALEFALMGVKMRYTKR